MVFDSRGTSESRGEFALKPEPAEPNKSPNPKTTRKQYQHIPKTNNTGGGGEGEERKGVGGRFHSTTRLVLRPPWSLSPRSRNSSPGRAAVGPCAAEGPGPAPSLRCPTPPRPLMGQKHEAEIRPKRRAWELPLTCVCFQRYPF